MDRRAGEPASWPLDAWYVACTADEIDAGPLGRTICDQALVIFRGPDGMARSFGIDDPGLTESIRAGQGRVFSEDLAMLEGQQANLLRWPERRLLDLNIDAGGAHARRMIARRIAEEHASA